MGDLSKRVPQWLLILALLGLLVLVAYAVLSGRKVEFFPPVIHASTADNEVLEAELIEQFPQGLRKDNISDTITHAVDEIQSLEQNVSELKGSSAVLAEKLNEQELALIENRKRLARYEELKDTFLYRLLSFHKDAQCYGTTLNFTAGMNRDDCVQKEELAHRFMDLLIELEVVENTQDKSAQAAKEGLVYFQQENEFKKVGWYSAYVFSALLKEFQSKA